MSIRSAVAGLFSLLFLCATVNVPLRADGETTPPPEEKAEAVEEAVPAVEEPEATPTPTPSVEPRKTKKFTKRRVEHADAFVAPADWEFDGFVAGGQDQEVRSLYYLSDLVYLNIGSDQGFNTGDRVGIFKRGQRIRDPQTGRFLGYEVRRAALSEVTDRVDAQTCSVRIIQANEAVEVGDLVRRDE